MCLCSYDENRAYNFELASGPLHIANTGKKIIELVINCL